MRCMAFRKRLSNKYNERGNPKGKFSEVITNHRNNAEGQQ